MKLELTLLLAAMGTTMAGVAQANDHTIKFDMVASAGAKACLPYAEGDVKIRSVGPVEITTVDVEGLPANTNFDFFVIQVPMLLSGFRGIRAIWRPISMAEVIRSSSVDSI
jgi:hypothetical protein